MRRKAITTPITTPTSISENECPIEPFTFLTRSFTTLNINIKSLRYAKENINTIANKEDFIPSFKPTETTNAEKKAAWELGIPTDQIASLNFIFPFFINISVILINCAMMPAINGIKISLFWNMLKIDILLMLFI